MMIAFGHSICLMRRLAIKPYDYVEKLARVICNENELRSKVQLEERTYTNAELDKLDLWREIASNIYLEIMRMPDGEVEYVGVKRAAEKRAYIMAEAELQRISVGLDSRPASVR